MKSADRIAKGVFFFDEECSCFDRAQRGFEKNQKSESTNAFSTSKEKLPLLSPSFFPPDSNNLLLLVMRLRAGPACSNLTARRGEWWDFWKKGFVSLMSPTPQRPTPDNSHLAIELHRRAAGKTPFWASSCPLFSFRKTKTVSSYPVLKNKIKNSCGSGASSLFRSDVASGRRSFFVFLFFNPGLLCHLGPPSARRPCTAFLLARPR